MSGGGDQHQQQVTAVMIAAAQSVAKVYVIGAIGWGATLLPSRQRALLPVTSVTTVARFSFHVLTLSLIYATTAQSVSPSTIGNFWFLIVGAFAVLIISYLTATVLGYVLIRIPIGGQQQHQHAADFTALRIAATFPNIVALPILIFPSLCEYPVVYEGYYYLIDTSSDDSSASSAELQKRCVTESNTMIFCYFFSWSLAFWTMGYPQLMSAAAQKKHSSKSSKHSNNGEPITAATTSSSELDATPSLEHDEGGNTGETTVVENSNNNDNGESDSSSSSSSSLQISILLRQKCHTIMAALKKTVTSPGFLALAAGVLTGCIQPLADALFEPGGALRFLGDALETLGRASSPLSTMVVAASLVPSASAVSNSNVVGNNDKDDDEKEEDNKDGGESLDELKETGHTSSRSESSEQEQQEDDDDDNDESPIMSDPNFGPYQRRRQQTRIRRLSRTVRRGSARIWQSVTRQPREMRRLLCWFISSRLIFAPAVVVATILGLECGGGFLSGVPNLAILVVIINSCLPGALIVVVLLKSNPELSDSAAAVAKVYLPSYLLSIVTITAWTAVGLWITLPDENGKTFCQR